MTQHLYDDAGRYIATENVAEARPRGPWDANKTADGLISVCAWCPDFDRELMTGPNVTHGMCVSCSDRMRKETDAYAAKRAQHAHS